MYLLNSYIKFLGFSTKPALVFLFRFSLPISLLRGGFESIFDLKSPIFIFFLLLYFNLNKWFSHRYRFFSSWFRHLSVVVCCSSSCATLFGFPSCCGVHLIHIEKSIIQSKIWASTLQIRRHDYSGYFYFIIYFCMNYAVICY